MAGKSRFRHGRKRSASGVVSVLKEARTPLERLAGYLESELTAKEAANIAKYPKSFIDFGLFSLKRGPRTKRQTTYKFYNKTIVIYEPPGHRNPRVSHHKGHITVNWEGDLEYHKGAWHKKGKGPFPIHYEARIFFKGTVAAPDDWTTVYTDFAGVAAPIADGAQKAWDDITSNSFLVITRNSASTYMGRPPLWGNKLPWRQRLTWLGSFRTHFVNWLPKKPLETAAYKASQLGGHCPAFNSALRSPVQWRWFSFPGVGRDSETSGSEPKSDGQVIDLIPGAPSPRYWWQWWNRSRSAGTPMFIDESECGLAIVNKVFPQRREIQSTIILEYNAHKLNGLLRLGLALTLLLGGSLLVYQGIKSLFDEEGQQTAIALEQEREKTEKLEGALDASETALDHSNAELERLKSIPRGLDKPPCWREENRLEFLLNVEISDAGLEIKRAQEDSELKPKWLTEFGALPFNHDLIGKTISAAVFKDEFEGVFNHTKDRNIECRHFVLVSEGEHTEVDRYKEDRTVIENYFYIKRQTQPKN